MARGFDALGDVDLTVIVNVGDDDFTHGLHVSPDLDTVVYTLAGVEGPQGWGRAGDTFLANDELGRFGVDTTFKLGDKDLALKLYRTQRLASGDPLSAITDDTRSAFGVRSKVLPATDDPVRTEIDIGKSDWISFREYFVHRRHRDTVADIRFRGSAEAAPAPGVIRAIADSDVVIVAPSNPPLSIWPVLSVPGVRDAVASHPRVIGVSPLIGGKALKGPADRVLISLGFPPGNLGVIRSYGDLLRRLVVDVADAEDAPEAGGVEIQVTKTIMRDREESIALARAILAV